MTKVMGNNYSNDTEFEMNNTLRKTSNNGRKGLQE